ncbi:cation-efflux pump [Candidatus Parcubacteria bacterium]|nr:MAG: cation-efflux pump [Candidatus Parcubacteria bacterium]
MKSHQKQTVALSSVFASAALTVLKLTAGLLTGSIGILSEAAHSALDFGAALITYFAVKFADNPPDKEHPYGHGKIENVSALIATGLLFATSIWIIYEVVQRLLFKQSEVEVTWYAIAIIAISIVVDFSRSRALSKVAKETKSHALEADALHFSSDILSSSVVLIGLLFVSAGIPIADSLAAIFVAIFIALIGVRLARRTIDVLIDAAPEGLTDKVIESAKKVEGVINIEKALVRPVGTIVFIDLVVKVSRTLTLESIQVITDRIEKRIRKIIPEAEMNISTKPLSLNNETIIEQVQMVALNNKLSVHDIGVYSVKDIKHISFHLEVDSKITIEEAHKTASRIEDEIKEEIGKDIEIEIHIEPARAEVVEGKDISKNERLKISEGILNLAKNLELVKDIHNIEIKKAQNKLFISFHCRFDNKTSIEKVHDLSTKLEYLIKEKIDNAQRIVIHPEPLST